MKGGNGILQGALWEDGSPDLTTQSLGIHGNGRGILLAKQMGILAGRSLFDAVMKLADRRIQIIWKMKDGGRCRPGQVVAVVKGPVPALLRAERPALNMLQRLSGVATLTRQYVEMVKGTKTLILDTRKTTPGWRVWEKYAVRMGGGTNHRSSLAEAILIKDNHLRFMPSVGEAVRRSLRRDRMAQVEVTSMKELQEAVGAGARMVLLDNFSPSRLKPALAWCKRHRVISEVSGGMTVAKARQAARWGAHRISVGALTHSVSAMNFSLELFPDK